MPSHAGPRGGPSAEDWFACLPRRKNGPWLVHRLDADTSGCLVVALRRQALHEAQAAFAAGRVEKVYWAVVHGEPVRNQGIVDLPLARRTDARGWRMVAGPGGQDAVTTWRVLGRVLGLGAGTAWLELRPRTGRTHQVRVHCAAMGCPVRGDPVYGSAHANEPGPLHLLARSIALPLDPPLTATAPVPPHMREALRGCGWDGDAL